MKTNSTSPLFAFLGCFATLNTVLAWLVGNSRMMYGMADEGVLPHALTRIDRRRHTPWATVLVMMLVTILSTLIGGIQVLVFSNMITALSLTILGCVPLILLRMRAPERERPFRVPLSIRNIPIPIVAALLVNVLIVSLLPPLSWVPFLIVTALGTLFYPILRQKTLSCSARIDRQTDGSKPISIDRSRTWDRLEGTPTAGSWTSKASAKAGSENDRPA